MGLFFRLATAFVCFLFVTPAQAESGAQVVVKTFYDQLVSTMKQGEKLGFSGRFKKLSPAVQDAFNLPLMARASVGSSWADASAAQKKEIIAAFSTFSISSYASRFAAYNGETFVVTGEKASGKDIIVKTVLKPKDGAPVSLNYLMRRDGKKKYRIVDVFLNGTISELATRRSEFSSIARNDGIPTLIKSLQDKAKKMEMP